MKIHYKITANNSVFEKKRNQEKVYFLKFSFYSRLSYSFLIYQNQNYSPAEVTQLRKLMPTFLGMFVLEQELGVKQY